MKKPANGDLIDLRAIMGRMVSKWYYFVASVFIIMLGAFFYLKKADRIYKVSASLLINKKDQDALQSDKFMKGLGLLVNDSDKEDEVGILKSYSLIRHTVQTLDYGISYYVKERFRSRQVYRDRPFTIEIDSLHPQLVGLKFEVEILGPDRCLLKAEGEEVSVYDPIKDEVVGRVYDYSFEREIKTGQPYEDNNLAFTITLDKNYATYKYPHSFVINSLSGLADHFRSNLEVAPVSKESNIIQLYSQGPVVEMQQKFMDKLLKVYMDGEMERNLKRGQQTLDFIEKSLASVEDSLLQIENALAQFRTSSRIVDFSSSGRVLTDNLRLLESERAKASVHKQYYEQILENLEAKDGVTGVTAPSLLGINDPLISDLLIRLNTYNQEMAALKETVKPTHPEYIALEKKIANTKASLDKSVEASVKSADIALENVRGQIGQTQGDISRLPKGEKELVQIQRKFDFHNAIHKNLSERRVEAGIAIANITINKEIIDQAKLVGDGPISPNSQLIYLIALVLGMGIPIGMLIVTDFLNTKIVSSDDLESSTNIPILGFIAKGDRNVRVVMNSEGSNTLLAESFRAVRINLQYLNADVEQHIIGVTSSIQGEGKTFCAMNLSVIMAQSGKRTLLIDVDLRRPQVAERMGLNNQRGISSYLAGQHRIDEIVQATRIQNLDIISSGPQNDNPLDLLGNPKMDELIATLRGDYDYIIIDTPPIVLASDYLIILRYVQYTIYVVRHGHTTLDALARINELYDSKKIRNIGLIINDVGTAPSTGYGAGYGYGYGYGYGNSKSKKKKPKKGITA